MGCEVQFANPLVWTMTLYGIPDLTLRISKKPFSFATVVCRSLDSGPCRTTVALGTVSSFGSITVAAILPGRSSGVGTCCASVEAINTDASPTSSRKGGNAFDRRFVLCLCIFTEAPLVIHVAQDTKLTDVTNEISGSRTMWDHTTWSTHLRLVVDNAGSLPSQTDFKLLSREVVGAMVCSCAVKTLAVPDHGQK